MGWRQQCRRCVQRHHRGDVGSAVHSGVLEIALAFPSNAPSPHVAVILLATAQCTWHEWGLDTTQVLCVRALNVVLVVYAIVELIAEGWKHAFICKQDGGHGRAFYWSRAINQNLHMLSASERTFNHTSFGLPL